MQFEAIIKLRHVFYVNIKNFNKILIIKFLKLLLYEATNICIESNSTSHTRYKMPFLPSHLELGEIKYSNF